MSCGHHMVDYDLLTESHGVEDKKVVALLVTEEEAKVARGSDKE